VSSGDSYANANSYAYGHSNHNANGYADAAAKAHADATAASDTVPSAESVRQLRGAKWGIVVRAVQAGTDAPPGGNLRKSWRRKPKPSPAS
jgi:hypothetical protein